MDKIWIVIQESNVDGEININVTPCVSLEIAQAVVKEEVDTLISEEGKYFGLDLDELEKRTQDEDDWDCDFNFERTETTLYLTCNVDDYHEYFDIVEKEIVKK